MTASRVYIAGTKTLCAIAVTLSVLLVFAGMRVAVFSGTCSPKPRSPRAVIETTVKDGQEAGSNKDSLAAACQEAVALDLPDAFAAAAQLRSAATGLIMAGRLSARAPPPAFPA